MKGLLTTVLMGAALAEFGFGGILAINAPSGAVAANTEQTVVSAERIVPTDANLPAYTPEQVAKATEQLIPKAGSLPPPGMQASRPEAAADIAAGVRHLDNSVRQIPGYAVKMAAQVGEHGIAALAYEDPQMKQAGNAIGIEVGTGIRHLATALAKDMIATANEARLR